MAELCDDVGVDQCLKHGQSAYVKGVNDAEADIGILERLINFRFVLASQ